MTKADLVEWARARWAEAYAADPFRTTENTRAVLGDACAVVASDDVVFVWTNLSTAQLRALSRAVFATCLEARG